MDLVTMLVVLALVATVVALAGGLQSMARGGAYDREHSVHFMFMRVGAQGVAVLLLIAALLTGGL